MNNSTHKYNLDEMDQFLKKHKLPQFTQYEIGNQVYKY